MKISAEEAARCLRAADDVLILMHRNPDGDAIGSGLALCHVLRSLGKRARVLCADPFPRSFKFLEETYTQDSFVPKTIVAVDIADPQLLGSLSQYAAQVDLCIDHHISNTLYAEKTYVVPEASSTAEVLMEIFDLLGVSVDQTVATCLYTGMATDTGCFKYGNTSPHTHRCAARLMEVGIPYAEINYHLIERAALDSMEFHFNDRCALLVISKQMLAQTGADAADYDGLSGMARQVEGVEVGITIREQENGEYKVSLRTAFSLDASAICKSLGGGGHKQAAGCTLKGSLEQVKQTLLCAVETALTGGKS